MQPKSSSRIMRLLSNIIKIREWFDWDRLKSSTLYIINGIKGLFIVQKTTEAEPFDDVVKQFNLTEKELIIRQRALLRLCILMLMIAALLLVYLFYQLIYGTYTASLISLVVMMLALVLAFRYHFWYFQIKRRQLGCSLKQWFRQGVLGEKE